MERNAGSGIALDHAEDQTEGTGENAGASDQSAELAPLYDRVEQALRRHSRSGACWSHQLLCIEKTRHHTLSSQKLSRPFRLP